MSATTEILKGPMIEAVKEQLAEEIRNVKCYEAEDAAHLLSLPVAKFRSLAKSIPSIEFGTGRKKWYSLADLGELVKSRKLPAVNG